MCRNIPDTGWHGDHYEVVLHDVIAPLVEHKTALASRAEQVHASVAQLWRIYRQKVGGIPEIYLHNRQKWEFYGAKIHIIFYLNKRFVQKVKIVTLFVKQRSVIFLVALNSPYSHD